MIKHMKLAAARALALAVAAAFVLIGVMRGEHSEVLKKAVRICLECIGIG